MFWFLLPLLLTGAAVGVEEAYPNLLDHLEALAKSREDWQCGIHISNPPSTLPVGNPHRREGSFPWVELKADPKEINKYFERIDDKK